MKQTYLFAFLIAGALAIGALSYIPLKVLSR